MEEEKLKERFRPLEEIPGQTPCHLLDYDDKFFSSPRDLKQRSYLKYENLDNDQQ
jgi:hypothetical protein